MVMNPKNRNENRRGSFPVSNNRRPLAVNFVHFGRHKSQDPAVGKGTFGIRFLGGKDAGRIRDSERGGDESATDGTLSPVSIVRKPSSSTHAVSLCCELIGVCVILFASVTVP
ncbi:unnamed protein product [Sphagnum jensenii]